MATPLLLPCPVAMTLAVAWSVTGPKVPYARYLRSRAVSKPFGVDGKMIGGFSRSIMCRVDQGSQEANSKERRFVYRVPKYRIHGFEDHCGAPLFKLHHAKTLRQVLLTQSRCKMSATATVGFHLTVRLDYESLHSWRKFARRYHCDWTCEYVTPLFTNLKDIDYMLEAYAILATQVKVIAHEIKAIFCFWTSLSSH